MSSEGGSALPKTSLKEGDATKEKIHEKLNQTAEDLGANRDVVVKNLRHSYEETQVATICTSGKTGRVLEKAAELKIELGECHSHIITDVPICFKCKKCGHIAAECKGKIHSVLQIWLGGTHGPRLSRRSDTVVRARCLATQRMHLAVLFIGKPSKMHTPRTKRFQQNTRTLSIQISV
ncbi:hypothetical protein HHI36_000719 [Cryptolaemus montrouzieri]|uniref:CCHC-type domain-containing protein n=1 Tax=Cryptolaemus montrouzieri TaxID=559131 RepID=A0ABD2P682_9CUCU